MRNWQRGHDDSQFNSGPASGSSVPDCALATRPGKIHRRPYRRGASEEVHLLLIEPAGTPNTGDAATAVPRRTARRLATVARFFIGCLMLKIAAR
jgi:hypothetical protein